MPCFSEITSSFALWGRAALRLPSRDGDGAPAPAPRPDPRTPWSRKENLWAVTGLRWGSVGYRSFFDSTYFHSCRIRGWARCPPQGGRGWGGRGEAADGHF